VRRWIFTLTPLLLTAAIWLLSYRWATMITVGRVGILFENAAVYVNGNGLIEGRSFIDVDNASETTYEEEYEDLPIARWQPIRMFGRRNKVYALALWHPPIMAALLVAWVKPWRKRGTNTGRGFAVEGVGSAHQS